MSDKKSKRFSESPTESDYSEPVAKRTRSSSRKQGETLIPVPVVAKPTILDVLNEDCWRLVLDYVSLRDVVRSERVSKQWRHVVYRYLRGARLYIRMCLYHNYKTATPSVKCRILDAYGSYTKTVIAKYGPAIVTADCRGVSDLRALGKHSPDLEELRLVNEQYHNLKLKAVHFNNLRRLYLGNVLRFKDAHISKLLGSPVLEELKILENQMMTGSCLSDLKSNLKTLELSRCKRLDITNALSASHHFSELTRLELNRNSEYVLQDVYKVLENTPKLEYLGLQWLKHLCLLSNQSVRDEWLEAVGRSCGEIRTVDVGGCKEVTAAGLEALCRGAGKTLTALGFSHSFLTDEDVARCVALCPNLQVITTTRSY
ncbi:uncharacterized protein LOC133522341 isoform X2 [Cydia pomonella]|uniref:uncharacterized protein LOC133522341 isoform X2 n=1 Tax=Cydia pomonella TaxID=82600 RepID=UPI002ADDECA0|nr:uncharacterized protein LOC133522341 isoform X2 [Cydia pomonella]